ncbi:hypothetical protein C8Q74DRAFT_1368092 [Fomes fomentarius]|nr:hypothetical protein C8Q74DRAFT_1368092 [Fomes fomentarius]
MSDRSQARLQRQRMLELQQEAADLEALKMTPEQFKILQDTFADVSIEFSDLDGLSWDTPEAREALRNWHAQQAARQHLPSADCIGLRVRGTRTRHSLSALLSPPPSSPSVGAVPISRTTSMRVSMGDDGDDSTEGTARERLTPFDSADTAPASPDKPLPSQNEEDRVQASDGSASASEQPAAALSQEGMSDSCSALGVSDLQHSGPAKPSVYSAWRAMIWRGDNKMFRNISPVLGPSNTDSEATSSVPASTSAPVSLATFRLSSRRRCRSLLACMLVAMDSPCLGM